MGVPNITAPPESRGGGMAAKNPNANSKAKGGAAVKRAGKKGARSVGTSKAPRGKTGTGYTR
jgi:hypothetical protein